MPAKTGDTVKVHYTGTLVDGSVFDTSVEREPITFTLGAGDVIPGFETAVSGLEPGEKRSVTIEPQDAYGTKHAELVQIVKKDDFVEEPFVGGAVNLVSPDGDQLPGTIVAIEGDDVTLDFNHPLAGQVLRFDLELVEVVPGSN